MLRTVRSKVCKRCGGNLFLERDEYGAYVSCIQCGAIYRDRVEKAQEKTRSEVTDSGREPKNRW